MIAAMSLPMFISLIGLALLLSTGLAHRQLRRAIRRRPKGSPKLSQYPSVTVVRPVRGRDVDAEANIAAALDTGYPGEVETLFVFDDELDPGLPLVRAAVEEHRASGRPGSAAVLVAGPPPPGRTGKLNAMMAGLGAARGELIAFGDSDTRPDRDVLRILVETLLTTPRAGSVFAPVVVSNPARTAGDVGYALLVNGLYGPSVALAANEREIPFIMGQLMVFRRATLAAIGGVACAEGQLVDDMAIGACIASAGLRNLQAEHPLHLATGGMSLVAFLALYRRWLLFARNGLPFSFTWPQWRRGVEFWLAALAGALALAIGHPTAALLPAAAVVANAVSVGALHRAFGGARIPWRHAWLTFALFGFAPAVFGSTLARRGVLWRGREYSLDAAARLA
jgi:ceramide glucosyltransferase